MLPPRLEPAELRDQLAVERTRLANERTLLAYVRTALGLVAAGVVLLQLVPGVLAGVAGWPWSEPGWWLS